MLYKELSIVDALLSAIINKIMLTKKKNNIYTKLTIEIFFKIDF